MLSLHIIMSSANMVYRVSAWPHWSFCPSPHQSRKGAAPALPSLCSLGASLYSKIMFNSTESFYFFHIFSHLPLRSFYIFLHMWLRQQVTHLSLLLRARGSSCRAPAFSREHVQRRAGPPPRACSHLPNTCAARCVAFTGCSNYRKPRHCQQGHAQMPVRRSGSDGKWNLWDGMW